MQNYCRAWGCRGLVPDGLVGHVGHALALSFIPSFGTQSVDSIVPTVEARQALIHYVLLIVLLAILLHARLFPSFTR